jgi:hypothetical protein
VFYSTSWSREVIYHIILFPFHNYFSFFFASSSFLYPYSSILSPLHPTFTTTSPPSFPVQAPSDDKAPTTVCLICCFWTANTSEIRRYLFFFHPWLTFHCRYSSVTIKLLHITDVIKPYFFLTDKSKPYVLFLFILFVKQYFEYKYLMSMNLFQYSVDIECRANFTSIGTINLQV